HRTRDAKEPSRNSRLLRHGHTVPRQSPRRPAPRLRGFTAPPSHRAPRRSPPTSNPKLTRPNNSSLQGCRTLAGFARVRTFHWILAIHSQHLSVRILINAIFNRVEPVSHFFYSDRLKLQFWDYGSDNKPALVLVHGALDHARNWDWVAQSLCA